MVGGADHSARRSTVRRCPSWTKPKRRWSCTSPSPTNSASPVMRWRIAQRSPIHPDMTHSAVQVGFQRATRSSRVPWNSAKASVMWKRTSSAAPEGYPSPEVICRLETVRAVQMPSAAWSMPVSLAKSRQRISPGRRTLLTRSGRPQGHPGRAGATHPIPNPCEHP